MNYEDMLQNAVKKMPKNTGTGERFEIPKVTGRIQGNQTIVTNFTVIAKKFSRDANQLAKYVIKELAMPGNVINGELHLRRKISPAMINEKIVSFAETYVICPSCGKPDTILMSGANTELKCNACGHKQVIKSLV